MGGKVAHAPVQCVAVEQENIPGIHCDWDRVRIVWLEHNLFLVRFVFGRHGNLDLAVLRVGFGYDVQAPILGRHLIHGEEARDGVVRRKVPEAVVLAPFKVLRIPPQLESELRGRGL